MLEYNGTSVECWSWKGGSLDSGSAAGASLLTWGFTCSCGQGWNYSGESWHAYGISRCSQIMQTGHLDSNTED